MQHAKKAFGKAHNTVATRAADWEGSAKSGDDSAGRTSTRAGNDRRRGRKSRDARKHRSPSPAGRSRRRCRSASAQAALRVGAFAHVAARRRAHGVCNTVLHARLKHLRRTVERDVRCTRAAVARALQRLVPAGRADASRAVLRRGSAGQDDALLQQPPAPAGPPASAGRATKSRGSQQRWWHRLGRTRRRRLR